MRVPCDLQRLQRKARGDAHADECRHVLRAGAAVSLLSAAGHLLGEAHAPAHPQRTDTLRTVELVSRNRQQIDAQGRS